MRPVLGVGFWVLGAVAAVYGVDGTVVNKTTGKPAANTTISLYRLGQTGMQILATVRTDAQGKFQIAKDAEGPRLLQTIFDGVVYNQMLPPGAPVSGVGVDVYNASKKAVEVAQHFFYLQPSGGRMAVNEVFLYRNQGNLTWNDAAGTLRFFAPAAATDLKVRATAPNGMPVDRPAEKSGEKNVHKVDFPVKPGDTRFEISYQLPYSQGAEFEGRVLGKSATPTMLVAPQGVIIEGEGLENKGLEPSTQSTIWAVNKPAFLVKVSGEGTAPEAADSGSSGPEIEQIAPRVAERAVLIVALACGVLALGFVLLYRKPQESHEPRGRR